MDAGAKLILAIRYHEDRRLPEAEILYREILQENSRHADALHLLGVLMHQIGRSPLAAGLIADAIAINPGRAAYHNNLGNALRATGDIAGAKLSFQRSIALNCREASTYVNRGQLHQSQGEWLEAQADFLTALRYAADNPQALLGLGNTAAARGDHAAAAAWCRKALLQAPRLLPALNALGSAQLALDDHEGAAASYRRAIAYAPSDPNAHINLANLYMTRKHYDAAVASYEQAIRCNPKDREALILLGVACIEADQTERAVHALACAAEIDPTYAPAYMFRGYALARAGDPAGSIAFYKEAIRLNPLSDEAHNNLGTAYEAIGDYAEAAACFAKALALKPASVNYLMNVGLTMARRNEREGVSFLEQAIVLDKDNAEVHTTLAEALLGFGDYERGWQEYEWRWRKADFSARGRGFDQPLWTGQPLQGKVILLHAEQGYGDTIQFVRFVEEVAHLGGEIVLEVQAELQRLMTGLPGVRECLRQGIDSLPAFDFHCPLLTLPLVLKTSVSSIPLPVRMPSIRAAEPSAGARPMLRTGLAWAGNPQHLRDSTRSMPLQTLTALRSLPGMSFTCLQKEIPSRDADTVKSFPMEFPLAACNDFLDTAKVMQDLDLIISVDTAVAHLAASMGKPVWLLLPVAPDWRWGMAGEMTPWYPGMILFRQSTQDGWPEMMQRLVDQLTRLGKFRSEGIVAQHPHPLNTRLVHFPHGSAYLPSSPEEELN